MSDGINQAHNLSPAEAVAAEGARIGFVTCLQCGAALMLSTAADSLAIHSAWHGQS